MFNRLARPMVPLRLAVVAALVLGVLVTSTGTVFGDSELKVDAHHGLVFAGNGAFATSLPAGSEVKQVKLRGSELDLQLVSPQLGEISVEVALAFSAAPPPGAPPFIEAAWSGTIVEGGAPGSGLEPGLRLFGSFGTPMSPTQLTISTGTPSPGAPPPNNLTAQFGFDALRVK